MKQLAIIALLLAVMIACAPVMPEKHTEDNDEDVHQEEPVEQSATEEVEEPVEPVKEEIDLSTVPVKEVIAGNLVSFPNLRAVDPDGDPITYTFTDPLDSNGEWQTKEGDEGDHLITITASDGQNTISQPIIIRVKSTNRAPVIEIDDEVQGFEGQTLKLNPTITDPDGDVVSVTFSGWMTSSKREISYDDEGRHKVTITATDGKKTSTKEVTVVIRGTNQAPIVSDYRTITVKEGQKVSIRLGARDPDGDDITYTYPAPLDKNGDWQTKVGDAGEYELTIIASDGALETEKTVKVVVERVNRPPVIELDSPVIVTEGQTVTLNPIITDPEGDEVRVSYSGWMNTNTKYTTYEDAGNYKVLITARDSAGNSAELEVIISVEDVNRPPVFGAGSFD